MAIHDVAAEPLDKFDRAILDLVQRDNTVPLRLVAEQVSLSTAAVQLRIKRMERGASSPPMSPLSTLLRWVGRSPSSWR